MSDIENSWKFIILNSLLHAIQILIYVLEFLHTLFILSLILNMGIQ
jgi:hypothetical protein